MIISLDFMLRKTSQMTVVSQSISFVLGFIPANLAPSQNGLELYTQTPLNVDQTGVSC